MKKSLGNIADLTRHPLRDDQFRTVCKRTIDETGALVLPQFLNPDTIASIQAQGERCRHLAYYTGNTHNIYLAPQDPQYPQDHPRNRQVSSSKGCITTDQIPSESELHALYNASQFREFLCAVLGETNLYPYADPLSSINLHYASDGQELGWHFDNSSFAITLMVQAPERGGAFEYVSDVRDPANMEETHAQAQQVLNGDVPANALSMDEGTLVLFRGRDALHRVTPVQGQRTRMLVVLAYNTKPDVALSESARMTFYGRLD
ncbi:MAG: 2OG-Fe(II) oxygenase [Pseudomonadota bacterium]